MPESLIPGIAAGEAGAVAKAITLIENGDPVKDQFFSELYNQNTDALRVGITGPPGAGKSTLVNELIDTCLSN